MEHKEYLAYQNARLRNLKRKHAKLIQHAEFVDEAEAISKEIKLIENELSQLQ